MNIPINFWKSTEGQFSENSFDQPLYSSQPNTAPEECDYFSIRKVFEDKSGAEHTIDEKTATAVANHLEFKGEIRESKSGSCSSYNLSTASNRIRQCSYTLLIPLINNRSCIICRSRKSCRGNPSKRNTTTTSATT